MRAFALSLCQSTSCRPPSCTSTALASRLTLCRCAFRVVAVWRSRDALVRECCWPRRTSSSIHERSACARRVCLCCALLICALCVCAVRCAVLAACCSLAVLLVHTCRLLRLRTCDWWTGIATVDAAGDAQRRACARARLESVAHPLYVCRRRRARAVCMDRVAVAQSMCIRYGFLFVCFFKFLFLVLTLSTKNTSARSWRHWRLSLSQRQPTPQRR